VPCGIFDDPKLVADVREACATIRKAMEKGSLALAAGGGAALDPNQFNQSSRWTTVKDHHCMCSWTSLHPMISAHPSRESSNMHLHPYRRDL
jgi:hypothetical protein